MINREFREGDRVTCALFGKGIIESVSVKFIDVKFENGIKEVLKSGDYINIEPMVKHWVDGKIDSQLVLIK